MTIIETHSEPETVKGRKPYRIRIEGSNGDAIEVVEQMTGGFAITAVRNMGEQLVIKPIAHNRVVIEVK